MKRVSFKVAKSIKEAGYPQGNTLGQYAIKRYYDHEQERELQEGQYSELFMILGVDAPTYLDVWLWLWKTKKMTIDVIALAGGSCGTFIWNFGERINSQIKFTDPEEAIINAIEFLVENNLIK